jgi:hypothetical protein
MTPGLTSRLTPGQAAPALALVLLAAAAGAQGTRSTGTRGNHQAPNVLPTVTISLDVPYVVSGAIRDLSRDSLGRILYCTAEGEVGRMEPGHAITVLADAASGPFPNELRALAETPAGDIATVDDEGFVRVLVGGTTPAVVKYADLYMVAGVTDLLIDARGSYLIASATPSSGQRAINWIRDDGQNWGYYLVRHQPVQLASDPLTGGILLSDSSLGGRVHLVEADNLYRPTSVVEATTLPGVAVFQDDGDIAAESNGDYYWAVGGTVYKHTRATSTTSTFKDGHDQLHGAVIAQSTGWLQSTTGWSLYVAEGESPTRIRELPGVEAPGALIANDQGLVPGRGLPINVIFGFNCFTMTGDNQGNLLLGGTDWGWPNFVKRVDLSGTPSISTVARSVDGLAGIIEGLAVAADDTIYALARNGEIHAITEGPLSVTDVFTDPLDQITAGKDLALDVDGSLYVGTREGWDFGKVMKISGGGASLLTITDETRGLAARPGGGMYVTQWHDTGFHGSVDLFHFADSSLEVLPGFSTMNYTNDVAWADGAICVNVEGSVFTVSEDDWSLVRYDPWEEAFLRFGSGYLNHPSGLVIAPSTATSGSTTGWSLYVSEWSFLWEKPSVMAPAPTLVDATLGLIVGRTLAGTPHPKYGRPSVLGPAPAGTGMVLGTESGWVLGLDASDGQVVPLFGPDDGLGAIRAIGVRGRNTLVLDDDGRLFELRGKHLARRTVDPERTARVLERVRRNPRRSLRLSTERRPSGEWFAIDGWVVWRVGESE